MSAITHRGIAFTVAVCAVVGSQLTSADALADPHNPHTITYIARVDSPISSARAIYMVNDTYTATAPLSATGREFTADTMLADPNKAGMQVSIPWPYSGNVHCEIDVDDHVAVLVDQFVASTPGDQGDPRTYGVVACGTTPLPVPLWWAKLYDAWWCTDTSFPSNARDNARAEVTRDSDPAASPPTASPDYPAL
ncbi:MAG: hypothetical protein QJR12_03480 [Mycobacterium sp.]|uniref:hypothetical protein n=1 Tax=Mycobacterium sp. TaxID=1785 RepID=UPI0026298ADC|nr:hypothetical protein [Mycobacterium sp.]MDI3313366.1 hypothetical protein [Mycobacterium sp.]